jgi:hypothetical protein
MEAHPLRHRTTISGKDSRLVTTGLPTTKDVEVASPLLNGEDTIIGAGLERPASHEEGGSGVAVHTTLCW